MPTDYNLPEWFWDDGITDEDRHIWFTQERCRRQAMSQDTPYIRAFKKYIKRVQRKQEARPDTVDLSDMR